MGREKLDRLLATLVPGRILGPDAAEVRERLTQCWDDFDGSDQQAMAAHKLRRAEDLTWEPLTLSFILERHGGTVQGSKRAEKQRWSVDLHNGQARVASVGFRQLQPNAPRWDARAVEAAATEVAQAILAGTDHRYLEWSKDRSKVRVMTGSIVPGGARQTVQQRSRRLREALETKLDGWVHGGGGWWRKAT